MNSINNNHRNWQCRCSHCLDWNLCNYVFIAILHCYLTVKYQSFSYNNASDLLLNKRKLDWIKDSSKNILQYDMNALDPSAPFPCRYNVKFVANQCVPTLRELRRAPLIMQCDHFHFHLSIYSTHRSSPVVSSNKFYLKLSTMQ